MFSLTPVFEYGKTLNDEFSSDSSRINLYRAAQAYLTFGWSIIPVHGNARPNSPKSPALKEWTTYQQRQPTTAEIDHWFIRRQLQGIGIVCGSVSHLAVLDIDNAQVGASFLLSLPDLADTLTVRSGGRCLPHYYFHIPENVGIFNKRIPGAELRYSGQYVVAPPTKIGDRQYEVVFPSKPHTLTESDLRRLLQFFEETVHEICENRAKPTFQVFEGYAASAPTSNNRVLLPDAAVAYYQSQVSMVGRNNALFSAALLARDSGWSQTSTQRVLVSAHVNQSVQGTHTETLQQRQREAERTIQSAFSRPQRVRQPESVKVRAGLPNAVRELLLQSGKEAVAAARLIDALLSQAGWQPGQIFTEREALEAVTPLGIGRRSVRNALMAAVGNTALFDKGFPPNPLSQNAYAARPKCLPAQSNKCFVGMDSKRVKSGRPSVYYVLPHPIPLCKRLGLKPQASDSLQAADLKTPSAYRQAQYRELVRRRPGQYTRSWLSQRLGISVATLRRYDRPAGIHTQPMIHTSLLDWMVASMLPEDEDMTVTYAFLECEGHKFPALRQIALGLLSRKKTVTYNLRLPNFYCLADSHLASAMKASSLSLRPAERTNQPRQFFTLPKTEADQATQPQHTSSSIPETATTAAVAYPLPPAADTAPQTALSKVLSRFNLRENAPAMVRTLYTGPGSWHPVNHNHLNMLFEPAYDDLTDAYEVEAPPPKPEIPGTSLDDAQAESLALCVYERLRALNPAKSLTIQTARQFVTDYGRANVQDVLGRVAWRRDLRNPAGYFIKILKTEHQPINANSDRLI